MKLVSSNWLGKKLKLRVEGNWGRTSKICNEAFIGGKSFDRRFVQEFHQNKAGLLTPHSNHGGQFFFKGFF